MIHSSFLGENEEKNRGLESKRKRYDEFQNSLIMI